MQLYTRSHTIAGNDSLVNYKSTQENIPDLMAWYPVAVARQGNMGLLTINRIIQPYLVNMVGNESRLVAEQIAMVARLHTVQAIDAYEEGFIMHADVNGENLCLVVCVLNLIDTTTIH